MCDLCVAFEASELNSAGEVSMAIYLSAVDLIRANGSMPSSCGGLQALLQRPPVGTIV